MTEFNPALVDKAARALLDARRLRWENVHQGECVTDARAVLSAVWDDIRVEGAREVVAAVEEKAPYWDRTPQTTRCVRAARAALTRIEGGESNPSISKVERGVWRHADDDSKCYSMPDSLNWTYTNARARCSAHGRKMVCNRIESEERWGG